jgi:isopentenyl phosphate kinase
MAPGLALIKLGGSVVTNKETPLSPNNFAIKKISKVLSSVRMPMILVHGGGSFGHYWSLKYDMHSLPMEYDPHGIAIVHESMLHLDQIIIKSMLNCGMNPYSIPPNTFTLNRKPIREKIVELSNMTRRNIIPITFGDIVHGKSLKYSIISGDEIMTLIAAILRPTKIIFALNVDGLYENLQNKQLIRIYDNINVVRFRNVEADVTGGMKRKVREALKISRLGLDVWIVNGLRPERIRKILNDEKVEGTVIKGKRGST